MNETVDVAVIGAGPYGLSLAAHLRAAGVSYRQFGVPLNLWRTAMPRGMYLKSQGFACSLSDPNSTHTLERFCRETGRAYADIGVPVSLDTFLEYGTWFERNHAPDVEQVLVEHLRRSGDRYELELTDGRLATARNVVVATGVEHFVRVPDVLSQLPAHLSSHASAHVDLGVFRDREVAVLGAGQSALETAALLRESGASVRIVARRSGIVWNGLPPTEERSLRRRLREPEAGLGTGWATWFYSEHPELFRRLPATTRVRLARTALGPAGAWWLRDRVDGRIPLLLQREVDWADPTGDRVRLGLRRGSETTTLSVDHVISATGYRPDITRLSFLDNELRGRVTTLDRTPRVGADYQSDVAGLFFIGPTVAPSFGPVMRFVYGADHASRSVTARISPARDRRVSVMPGAGR
ncbi:MULTISPECIES: FAD-dependent oxidoreductase [Actinopolyspora]|uniref:Predicted flavoprotein CzcO associated with the cation diffusion facilitator CzcD n=1 Tax=Actinopolyspora saharensis TaxID=995062 RepID=A0A1H1ABQ7_9ACTN|nr:MULTISPECIES: FAD-dependent oxidoreductase [Actinopolyspora]NHD16914.1 lysine N(6)-hydroxylase/L-ornithine N(5)-oxygenase family protein [Actinopolyspora sp. BKK2]NHE76066.1 lysine N(6)-hydroxylase/L-ornithine N(5)-oxygenase family protein [Actinopolyspora sp. BKK1]SDQ36666.1 Predicted flavoprotein CzcO associated with the cation diffusion facilitator CzcD [Actinopolyspora saharensis]